MMIPVVRLCGRATLPLWQEQYAGSSVLWNSERPWAKANRG